MWYRIFDLITEQEYPKEPGSYFGGTPECVLWEIKKAERALNGNQRAFEILEYDNTDRNTKPKKRYTLDEFLGFYNQLNQTIKHSDIYF